jgi:two-component system, chemotaxis family, protein-glutamate methylesterase/glutaminase
MSVSFKPDLRTISPIQARNAAGAAFRDRGLEHREPAQLVTAPLFQDRIIAIGASTGGVAALQVILSGLARAPLPIVIVQHMPPRFTARFVEHMRETTGYDVKEAEDGDAVTPGRVLLAPGHRHLKIAGPRLSPTCRLDEGPPVSGHRPSVDVLFQSVAEVAGPHSVGVLLTGMGRDGADGLLAMRRFGAQTLCESKESAVVFGMPKVALDIGAADDSAALPEIAEWILIAASERPMEPPAPRGHDPYMFD